MILEGGYVVPFVAVAAATVGVRMRAHDASWVRIATMVAFLAYLGLVVSLTLFPITIGAIARPEVANLRDLIHLGLFDDLANSETARRQAGPNVLLGIPFGLFLPLLGVRSVWKVIVLGLAFGVAIEGLQLLEDVIYRYEYRTVDINDVALNWLGVAVGLVLYLVATGLTRWWLGARRPRVPEAR